MRLYICDTGLLSSYVALSVEYLMTSGIQVILMTPAAGESCAEGLARYMASDTPPTMFCLHRQETLEQYADGLYDLSGTAAAQQLYSPGFGMYDDGALLALPVAVDWFGFVYNTELLAHAATISRTDFYRTDMSGYNSMAYIVKYLTSLKNYPFGKPDLTATGLAPLLCTAFRDSDRLRSFMDLYIGNCRSTTNGLSTFQSEKSVFYAGTTACFDEVLKLGIHKLDLLPAFVSDSDAMQYTCDTFWAVAGTGYGPDVQETLAFLRWMVSPGRDSTAPVDSFGLLSPYKSATVSRNALEKLLRQYMAQEPARLTWEYPAVTPENMEAFCAALAAYYKTPNDTTWAEVKKYLS